MRIPRARQATAVSIAYSAEYGKYLDRDDDVVPALGSARQRLVVLAAQVALEPDDLQGRRGFHSAGT